MGKLTRILVIAMVAATWVLLSHSEQFRSHFWLMILLAVVSTGLLGGVLGLLARRRSDARPSTPDERIVALREVKKRYPAAIVTLIILMVWMIVIRGETFGELRSHFWLVVIGLGASVGFLWAIPALIRRWWQNSVT
jgi:hypothetical protein